MDRAVVQTPKVEQVDYHQPAGARRDHAGQGVHGRSVACQREQVRKVTTSSGRSAGIGSSTASPAGQAARLAELLAGLGDHLRADDRGVCRPTRETWPRGARAAVRRLRAALAGRRVCEKRAPRWPSVSASRSLPRKRPSSRRIAVAMDCLRFAVQAIPNIRRRAKLIASGFPINPRIFDHEDCRIANRAEPAGGVCRRSQARNRYTYFTGQAKKRQLCPDRPDFRRAANRKRARQAFLQVPGRRRGGDSGGVSREDHRHDRGRIVLAAANGEDEEWTKLYPGFAEVARSEGFPAIAKVLEMVASLKSSTKSGTAACWRTSSRARCSS